jgi:hypothetical protein
MRICVRPAIIGCSSERMLCFGAEDTPESGHDAVHSQQI